jgi:hypothetical protein
MLMISNDLLNSGQSGGEKWGVKNEGRTHDVYENKGRAIGHFD